MMASEARGNDQKLSKEKTLGEELRQLREGRGLTLRAVEDLTKISNAYLSQIETGKISEPSPHFLYKLAEAYGVPYTLLMERAGYIRSGQDSAAKSRPTSLAGAALATMEDLTPDEAEELMRYLAFLRSKRPKTQTGKQRGG